MPWARSRSSWMVSFTASASGVEHLGGAVRVVAEHVLREAEVHGQGHQVLLGAVVQVALDLAALGVAGGHDAGARRAQVVVGQAQVLEALLERRVELHVVEGEADLAGQLGEHAVVLVGEGVGVGRPLDHEQAEQRRRCGRPVRPGAASGARSSRSAGSHTSSQALPVTPARVTTGCSCGPSSERRSAVRSGTDTASSSRSGVPVQISARRRTSTLRSDSASWSRSSSIGMDRLRRLPHVRSTSSGGCRSP